MSSLRAIRRPATGDFQTEVRTVLPFHATSRGRPTFTESNLGIRTSSKSSVWLESIYFRASGQLLRSQRPPDRNRFASIDLLQSICFNRFASDDHLSNLPASQ